MVSDKFDYENDFDIKKSVDFIRVKRMQDLNPGNAELRLGTGAGGAENFACWDAKG
jgi:hypothetical protein